MRASGSMELTAAEMELMESLVGKTKPGRLVPQDLIIASRAKTSPTHHRFEWDDSMAATQYRQQQARDLIQIYVTILPGSNPQPVRAMVSLGGNQNTDSGYMPIRKALKSRETVALLKLAFVRDVRKVLEQYGYLEPQMEVEFRSIRKTLDKVEECNEALLESDKKNDREAVTV